MTKPVGSDDARRQQAHYDKVARAYEANLNYPHTRAYFTYLDNALLMAMGERPLGRLVEVCCGLGEAVKLFAGRYELAIGLDVSMEMLRRAVDGNNDKAAYFVQGDAVQLPLQDASFDTVVMLGGIHHVNDRGKLFAEVARILKPGGRFIFREPVSDFLLWRALRAIIYRVSSKLDHATERPLRWHETAPVLGTAGLNLNHWSTHGFFGFCVFMNSDVLIFNRLFRFVPGIVAVTRAAAKIDALILKLPGMSRMGLQVVEIAAKPE